MSTTDNIGAVRQSWCWAQSKIMGCVVISHQLFPTPGRLARSNIPARRYSTSSYYKLPTWQHFRRFTVFTWQHMRARCNHVGRWSSSLIQLLPHSLYWHKTNTQSTSHEKYQSVLPWVSLRLLFKGLIQLFKDHDANYDDCLSAKEVCRLYFMSHD